MSGLAGFCGGCLFTLNWNLKMLVIQKGGGGESRVPRENPLAARHPTLPFQRGMQHLCLILLTDCLYHQAYLELC